MKYIFTIGFLWLNSLLFAQQDLRNGFIITNSNDTIYGLNDYKSNKANALKCQFKADSNSVDQVFCPKDIKGYRFINSKLYIPVENHTKFQLKTIPLINAYLHPFFTNGRGIKNDKNEYQAKNYFTQVPRWLFGTPNSA